MEKPAQIVVTSTVAGRRRGGEVFAGTKTFALNHFSAAQLHELVADSVLSVVIGRPLSAADVDAFLAELAAKPKTKA